MTIIFERMALVIIELLIIALLLLINDLVVKKIYSNRLRIIVHGAIEICVVLMCVSLVYSLAKMCLITIGA